MKPVDQKKVAVFLPDGGALSHDRKPLMLQEVLFCPVLTWCVRAWKSRGVERFFLVCEEALRQQGFDGLMDAGSLTGGEEPEAPWLDYL